MNNADVARTLDEIADLLELKEENVFKVRAYRKAARAVESLPRELQDYHDEGSLADIPGVGKAIADKISELLETGELQYLERLRSEFPPALIQVMEVPDVGPKTTLRLYRSLGIESVEDLKQAAIDGRIRELKGFGPTSEERILRGIEAVERRTGRLLLGIAYPVATRYRDYLAEEGGLDKVSIAGSLRRMRETIGDIDLLAGGDRPQEVMDIFVSYPDVMEVLVKGGTKASVRLLSGLQVDLRVVEERSFGAALQYFTGSKDHNVELRKRAIDMGYKINEYGIFLKDSGERVGGGEEGEIYEMLGLQLIPPELRESRGEIEAASQNALPHLIELDGMRGDLHVHTEMSDGNASIEEMALNAREMGYQYLGIADHSQSLRVARGLTEEQLAQSLKVSRQVSEGMEGFRVLQGVESDIKDDGSLDYPGRVLKDLDFVIGAVHSRFNMDKKEMTGRLINALSNEHLTILAHPTGRIIERREPYPLDLDAVMEAALEKGIWMELNAFPDRLDLNDVNCRKAKGMGLSLALGTDAHRPEHLKHMRFGVATARRGWLEPDDVVNSLPLREMERRLGI